MLTNWAAHYGLEWVIEQVRDDSGLTFIPTQQHPAFGRRWFGALTLEHCGHLRVLRIYASRPYPTLPAEKLTCVLGA